MRRLSKNKNLNNVLLFQEMLLWETTGGELGQKPKNISDIPYVERLKLLTIMQNSALIANKVDPKTQQSGLSELRDMLRDDGPTEVIGDGGTKNPDGRIKSPPNGSAAAIFAAAAESANYDAEGNELPALQ